MKKPLLLMLIIAAFVYSCKKSSTAGPTVVGTWYVKTDSTATGGSPLTVSNYNLENNYQFNADGSGRRNFNGGSDFTYKLISNTIYIYYSQHVEGTTTVSAYNDTCSITTLTATKLSLLSEFNTIFPNGVHVRVTEFRLCSK